MRALAATQVAVFNDETEAGVKALAKQIVDVAVHDLAHRLAFWAKVGR